MAVNRSRPLSNEEIEYILDFLRISDDNPAATRELIQQIADRYISELLTVKINPAKLEDFKKHLIEITVGSSSLLAANMIRSSHNSVKVVTQSTISSKRGAEGKNALQKKTLLIRQIKSFAESRSINMIWLHAAEQNPTDLAISLLAVNTVALVKDVKIINNSSRWDPNKGSECVEIKLHATRLFEYHLSMYDVVSVIKKQFPGSKIVSSLEREGIIHIYRPTNSGHGKSVASFMGEVQHKLLDLHVKGIKGVTDSYVDEFSATESISNAERVIAGANGYKYRSRVNLAQIISNHMLEEDVVIAFSEEFDDFEYNTTNHYFYYNDTTQHTDVLATQTELDNKLKNVRNKLKKQVITVIYDMTKGLLDTILIDPRFDRRRTLFNDLHYCYDERGSEYALQWSNFELKMYSENFEYHTHHALIERTFALGFPTPITEKGNRERDNGVMAAITFGKGEDTVRKAAVEQTYDLNNNVYSAIKIGNPAPFGTNVRLGKHPYVQPYKRISEENNIEPYEHSITNRIPKPEYIPRILDFTEGLETLHEVKEPNLTPIDPDDFRPEL
jgi:hypothetical protein